MPGETPTDVPPAAFGRFRVLHQIGAGSLGPVFRGEDPQNRTPVSLKQFQLKLSPNVAGRIADDLRKLQGRSTHSAVPRVIDAGLQGNDPFLVTAFAPGESLDAALREFGPAAIADALPRLRLLAEALDRSAAGGLWHGALQPRKVLIDGTATHLVGLGVTPILERHGVRRAARRPYAAPELTEGVSSSSKADQYALAAIAYEWFFGGRAPTSAESVLDAPNLPGVDAEALASALMTALATNPSERFASCTAFIEAIDEALVSSVLDSSEREEVLPGAGLLPLEAFAAEEASDASPDDIPLRASPPTPPRTPPSARPSSPRSTPTRSIVEEPPTPLRLTPEPVAWQGTLGASSPMVTPKRRTSFSTGMIVTALIGGAAIGGAAGYLFATSRLASSPSVASPADSAAAATTADAPPAKEFTDAPVAGPSPPPPPTSQPPTSDAARAAVGREASEPMLAPPPAAETPTPSPETASLLVRSSPSGAVVSVDGVSRGATPLTLRDLALGTRTVSVSRPGYATSERRVSLTAERPSRSVDFQLSPISAATSRTAREPRSTATTSTLVVDSRPSGSSVVINGQAAGTTPLIMDSVTPGTLTIRIERAGYRPYTETIELKAGERRRVAASLELEQE